MLYPIGSRRPPGVVCVVVLVMQDIGVAAAAGGPARRCRKYVFMHLHSHLFLAPSLEIGIMIRVPNLENIMREGIHIKEFLSSIFVESTIRI